MREHRELGLLHFATFLSVLLIGLAVLELSTPTGFAALNQTITASGVADLKPFLTAVGLLMALFITVALVFGRSASRQPAPAIEAPRPPQKAQSTAEDDYARQLREINKHLAAIRRKTR
jgi:hypothetical protein